MGKNKHHHKHTEAPAGIKIIQKNKKAFFEYEILERIECGIILLGPEVKSIKENKVQFADSHARIHNGRLLLHNMHVSPYKFYTQDELNPVRVRELLVHKKELEKLKKQLEEKGRSIVPLTLYLKQGMIKVEMGVGRGKKLHDKKETLKAKTAKREAEREIKAHFKG